jgi:hypothetical protein
MAASAWLQTASLLVSALLYRYQGCLLLSLRRLPLIAAQQLTLVACSA